MCNLGWNGVAMVCPISYLGDVMAYIGEIVLPDLATMLLTTMHPSPSCDESSFTELIAAGLSDSAGESKKSSKASPSR